MFVIRNAQLEVFRKHLEQDFRRRMCRRIRETVPAGIMDDGQIEANVAAGLRQARDCGFQREVDIARFVEAICLYLGGIPKAGLPKQVLPILYAYRADPEIKIQRFIDWCQRHGRAAEAH
jgi:hypothetical protein